MALPVHPTSSFEAMPFRRRSSQEPQQWDHFDTQPYPSSDFVHQLTLQQAYTVVDHSESNDGFSPYGLDELVYSDPNYSPASWNVDTQLSPPNSLLFDSGSVDPRLFPQLGTSSTDSSPFMSDTSYFPSNSSYPFETSMRQVPQIHVDTSAAIKNSPSVAHRHEPLLSPYGYSGQSSGLSSSSQSSGGCPSIALPTPATSPSVLGDGSLPVVRRPSVSSASPGSPYFGSSLVTSMSACGIRNNDAIRSVPELADLMASPTDGPIIPQKTYRPHTQSDRRRYVEEIELAEPIMFLSVNHDRCGISLTDALHNRFMELDGRDDPMFIDRGPSVSIRISWPGYAPWSRQIPTKDFRSPPLPITRSKLAKNVAKTVQRFIEEVKVRPMEDESERRWRVGNGHINVDDLVLLGLQHVSKGSWQVHLRLRRRRV